MITQAQKLLLLCAVCTVSSYAQQKYALVIGIAGYPSFNKNEQVRYADRDATDFAAFIQTFQGGSFPSRNVHLVTNSDAKRERLYEEFNWLYKTLGPQDVLYVFFSGHGVEYRSTSYFLPYNASMDNLLADGIPMSEFFKRVTVDTSAKQVVVFIDACHAGAAEGAKSPLSADIQKEWESSNAKEGQVTMALFSSMAYEKSWEDAKLSHGLFTWYLLEGLKGAAPKTPQGFITAEKLWDYVRANVESRSQANFAARQTPFASINFRSDFVLAYSTPDLPSPLPPPNANSEKWVELVPVTPHESSSEARIDNLREKADATRLREIFQGVTYKPWKPLADGQTSFTIFCWREKISIGFGPSAVTMLKDSKRLIIPDSSKRNVTFGDSISFACSGLKIRGGESNGNNSIGTKIHGAFLEFEGSGQTVRIDYSGPLKTIGNCLTCGDDPPGERSVSTKDVSTKDAIKIIKLSCQTN
jgi:hypothetical protein